MSKPIPLMKRMCKTCPFRETGWTHVRPLLIERSLTEATPICHSTGEALVDKPLGPSRLCRGARDFQLQFFAGIGFIEAATDAAWEKRCRELGIDLSAQVIA